MWKEESHTREVLVDAAMKLDKVIRGQ